MLKVYEREGITPIAIITVLTTIILLKDIPVIFYFSGTHEDYHLPTDTVEKINYPLLTKRAQFIFHTLWELANREDRIKLNSNKST